MFDWGPSNRCPLSVKQSINRLDDLELSAHFVDAPFDGLMCYSSVYSRFNMRDLMWMLRWLIFLKSGWTAQFLKGTSIYHVKKGFEPSKFAALSIQMPSFRFDALDLENSWYLRYVATYFHLKLEARLIAVPKKREKGEFRWSYQDHIFVTSLRGVS